MGLPRTYCLCGITIFGLLCGCGSTEHSSVAPPAEQPLTKRSVYGLTKEERRERFESRQDEGVGYYNPKTGYSADYTLDVEYTPDGEVERINFPNGGWIDDFDSQEEHG